MMWSEKYRPTLISDLLGNEESRSALVEWIVKWKKGVKPILLVGPPGIGKTTIANLISKQFGYDLISLNASDVRSKSRIQEILKPVLGNETVLGSPMIFVDEVDGIHGRSDYGGTESLIKILKEPTVPIILAANSDSSEKMKSIKKVVKTISFKPLSPRMIKFHVNTVLKKEGHKISPGSLIKAINESNGDLRSIINSVQSLVTGFDPPTEKSFETMDIENGINSFFKAKTIDEARSILYSIRIDPREKINSFYSSIITSNVDQLQLAKMLEILSEADMLYGKIIRTQNWRILRYLDSILLGLYLKDSPIRYTRYNLPWPLLNRIRWDGRKIKSLAELMSKNLHISKSTFATFVLNCILICMKNNSLNLDLNPEFDELLQKEMDLIK